MAGLNAALDEMVTAMVPTLSRSLAEQFNVFRVMHHGTHEKQLSNVFAWLLRPEATHELGDAFQRIFVDVVNRSLPATEQVPLGPYAVVQEVNTSETGEGKDIADILLSHDEASIVVENYEVSDGHGHGYDRYLAHGRAGGRHSVVVLLCMRHESHLLREGWQDAVVVTYAELLERLRLHIAQDGSWRAAWPQQDLFLTQMMEHFVDGPQAVSPQDRIAFITAMCQTGESVRYGHLPHERAAQEFADLVAAHAQHQFTEGRRTLAEVKNVLRRHAEHALLDQLNRQLTHGRFTDAKTPYNGLWQWCIALPRADDVPTVHLEFGPTAVIENQRVPEPLVDPDYSKIFVTRHASTTGDAIDHILQTDVGLAEVLGGLDQEDMRLRDTVMRITELP